MPDLSGKDLRAVLDIVYALGDDQGEGEIPEHVLAQLGNLVGCESLSYNRVDPTTGRFLSTIVEPTSMDITGLPGFDAVIGQHPWFNAYRTGRVALGTSIVLTELADPATLGRLVIYTDFLRPHGIHDGLFCMARVNPQQASGLAFNRARRGFSHRDRAVVDLFTPHLAQMIGRRERLASLTAAVRSLGRHRQQVEQALPRLSTLTSREREVIEHLIGGVTDREIARSMAISQRTVHKHLQRIYRKLDLGNRTSLIALVRHISDTNLPAAG
jgi:DNA-binding CsgD family transcriptional regulator